MTVGWGMNHTHSFRPAVDNNLEFYKWWGRQSVVGCIQYDTNQRIGKGIYSIFLSALDPLESSLRNHIIKPKMMPPSWNARRQLLIVPMTVEKAAHLQGCKQASTSGLHSLAADKARNPRAKSAPAPRPRIHMLVVPDASPAH
jgi:hypothetical protein